jgi:hypothetical protein
MKIACLLTIPLCLCAWGDVFTLDTADICTYTMRKINNDSAFHKYDATLYAKSKFDSLIYLFRSKLNYQDSSMKSVNTASGGIIAEANNYMTSPVIHRIHEIIEQYCIGNNVDVFVIYPPYGIEYAQGEINYYPDPSDSIYLRKIIECSIPDVTDTLLRLLNNDPTIPDIRKKIDKEYKRYKKKIREKIDAVKKEKNKSRVQR